jgi:hypothetical protein
MTHRSFIVVAKDDCFGLAISTSYEKSKNRNRHFIYDYFSAKANNDIERLKDHFKQKKFLATFVSIYGKPLKTEFKRDRHDLSGALSGCVKKARRKVSKKAYNLYVINLENAFLKPMDRDVYDPNYRRKRYRRRNKNWHFGLKKKFTGKKIKIAEDLLYLKGKGGCYCFMPYENTDDNNKALFKIGMTLDFSSRLDDPSRQYCCDV